MRVEPGVSVGISTALPAEMYVLKACTCVYANAYLTEVNHAITRNGDMDPKLCEQND